MPFRAIVAVILSVVWLSIAGCNAKPASPPTTVPVLPPPTDKSLEHQKYLEAGVPAHDRRWTGDDMQRAASALSAIAQNNAGHLPRYQSPNSGEVFARLTADENLEFYRNRSVPLPQRLTDANIHMQSENQILKLYVDAFQQQAISDSELVELLGAQLRLLVVLLNLVDEFLPTLDTNDPTYALRLEGLKQMKSGLATVVAGNLQTLTESHAYRTAELKRLIGYMESTFPEILPALPEASRSETLNRLRAISSDPQMQHLQPEIGELLAVSEKLAK